MWLALSEQKTPDVGLEEAEGRRGMRRLSEAIPCTSFLYFASLQRGVCVHREERERVQGHTRGDFFSCL